MGELPIFREVFLSFVVCRLSFVVCSLLFVSVWSCNLRYVSSGPAYLNSRGNKQRLLPLQIINVS